MKKELALRIVQLNELIVEQKDELSHLKEAIKGLEESREAYLRELVMLVNDDDTQ